MKPQPIETKHVLMACPVCSQDIVATVLADVSIGPGTYNPGANALDLPVTARPTRFNVQHYCAGRAEADPDAVAALTEMVDAVSDVTR
jgi:hypothetical protein